MTRRPPMSDPLKTMNFRINFRNLSQKLNIITGVAEREL